jgi:hypothetical protein
LGGNTPDESAGPAGLGPASGKLAADIAAGWMLPGFASVGAVLSLQALVRTAAASSGRNRAANFRDIEPPENG